MVEGRTNNKEAGTGEAQPPPFSRERFEKSPEFDKFKEGMKKLISVPKAVLDARVKAAKERSPRKGKLDSPGRRPKRSSEAL